MDTIKINAIYNADPLNLMERIDDESFDLVILDPPWGSNLKYDEAIKEHRLFISKLVQQSHRVLRETGSLFCMADSNLNLGIKPILTATFGEENFKEEYIMKNGYTSNTRTSQRVYIIHFTKSDILEYHPPTRPLTSDEIERGYPYVDENGHYRLDQLTSTLTKFDRPKRHYEWMRVNPPKNRTWRYPKEKLDELFQEGKIHFSSQSKRPMLKRYVHEKPEVPLESEWNDLFFRKPFKIEGTQTFAPSLELMTRIINMASNPSEIVLAPFSGTGSALIAAEKAQRKWISCVESEEAFRLTKQRYSMEFGQEPTTISSQELLVIPIKWNDYVSVGNHEISEEEQLLLLIRRGESKTVEFKEASLWNAWSNQREKSMIEPILKAIVGFGNSREGGILVIGINDKTNEIIGLKQDIMSADSSKKNEDGYIQWLNNNIRDRLNDLVLESLDIKILHIESVPVCQIIVKPFLHPFFWSGNFYLRQTSQTNKLSSEDSYKYIKSRWEKGSSDINE